MALDNLRAELVRNRITQTRVAEYLGMTLSNFSKKLSGEVPMTVCEAKKLRDVFLPEVSLDYLLASSDDVSKER